MVFACNIRCYRRAMRDWGEPDRDDDTAIVVEFAALVVAMLLGIGFAVVELFPW
ncbi:MAG: hypothetical protein K5799_03995 [Erythrobacter sp.]|nr:hypothetical protein [Erythrobacter sp.]